MEHRADGDLRIATGNSMIDSDGKGKGRRRWCRRGRETPGPFGLIAEIFPNGMRYPPRNMSRANMGSPRHLTFRSPP